MIAKGIRYSGGPMIVACDAKCSKAWGINNRPVHHRREKDDPLYDDDIEYLADGELGDAPVDPGTYEGGYAKPTTPEERLNKWCTRECERSGFFEPFELIDESNLPSFKVRLGNIKDAE